MRRHRLPDHLDPPPAPRAPGLPGVPGARTSRQLPDRGAGQVVAVPPGQFPDLLRRGPHPGQFRFGRDPAPSVPLVPALQFPARSPRRLPLFPRPGSLPGSPGSLPGSPGSRLPVPRGRGTGAVLGALPVPLLRPLRFPQYRIPHLAAPEDPLDHPGGRGALRGAPRPLFLVPLPLFAGGQPEHPLSRPPPEPLRRPPMLTPTLHRHRRHVHHGSRHRGSQPYREPPEDYPHPDHHHPFGSQRSVLGSPYSPGLVPSGPTRTSSGHATHLPTITVPPSGAHADVHRHSITCRCRPIATSA